MKIIASRIKSLREERGYSQKQVAQALFISNTSLSNYELNVSTPPPEVLVGLSKLFGVSLDYLYGVTDIELPNNGLNKNEALLLQCYAKLTTKQQKVILELIKDLVKE